MARVGMNSVHGDGIQVLHDGAMHWVLTARMEQKVLLYDSLKANANDMVRIQICELFPGSHSNEKIKVQIRPCQIQKGGVDCGLFALANAVELALGNDLSKINFDQTKMRPHLRLCLESGQISSFPQTNMPQRRTEPSIESVPV